MSAKLSVVSSAPDSVELIRADTIEPVAIYWVWDGYLAGGKVIIIAGAPGTGKTTLALAMAANISCGGLWPDGTKAKVGNVLIWSGEDDPADTLIPRLIAMGADLRHVHFVGMTTENSVTYPFDPARDMALLSLKAAELGEVSLMIVDPIVSAVAGDSHKNSETRRGLQPLVDLTARLECATVGITHFTKGTQGRDPVERVTASLAFGAMARIVLVTAKPRDGSARRLVRAKSNISVDGGGFSYDLQQLPVPGFMLDASCVAWGSALDGTARDLLADAEADVEDPGKTNETTGWLRTLLTEEAAGLSSREVMKAARENGHTERTVHRARETLEVLVHLTGFGKNKRSVWTLPMPANHKCQ